MNPLIQLKKITSLFVIVFLLACFALPQKVQAVSPPPDGGYPGGNTAEGQTALLSLTTGGFNTAAGFLSLRSNTIGSFNTAVGAGTLLANTADQNTATGAGALLSNTTGFFNTADGAFALSNNTTGTDNTAIGASALQSNTIGVSNTAIGLSALSNNTTGSLNTALGTVAGVGVTTANNVICIGEVVTGANVSSTTWIGNIYGTTTVSGTTLPVIVSDGGQLGTASSSRRFKNEIKPMDTASEAILALRPVTFQYKSDKTGTPQFGLIAEEVAEVNPNLVVRDKNGEIYTVRYDAVNAMLLNEFLKEHQKVQGLEATVVQQRKDFQEAIAQQRKDSQATAVQQQKEIETLNAGLQRVSAQLEVSKPAPQTVLSNQ